MKTVTVLSLSIFAFMAFLTWHWGPGFINQDSDVSMTELLERFKVNELCFECKIISMPRSFHCNVCRRCVQRYDHHCPWINSCIGTRNHAPFLIFITFQLVYILSIVIQVIGFFITFASSSTDLSVYSSDGKLMNTCWFGQIDTSEQHFLDICLGYMHEPAGFFGDNDVTASNIFVAFFMSLLFCLALPFIFGLLSLCLVQLVNFCSGLTTMERLGSLNHRTRRFTFVEQIEERVATLEDD